MNSNQFIPFTIYLFPKSKEESYKDKREGNADPECQQGAHVGEGHLTERFVIARRSRTANFPSLTCGRGRVVKAID